MAYDLIGKNFTPPDIYGKVTGKAKYAEDYRADGMVFCRILGSPMPHARVKKIDASAALAASPPNTAARGTQVALSASASCPGTATYRFWVRPPGGAWQIARDYSLDNSFSWKPVAPGSYGLEVDVRDQGGADSYEAVANITYGVT